MLGPELELSLSIPEQNLGNLSFANATPESVQAWVADLPMANLGETSRLLYSAINELNRLSCKPTHRSKMLESLRKPIHYACAELSKHFLNGSVSPQEKQRKVINLVLSLRLALSTGYKAVLIETVPELGSEMSRKNFACAAHRIMSELGQVLLLSSKLYVYVPQNVWKDMNEIYRFSDDLGLMKYLVLDEENEFVKETSIRRAYKRNLLLACSRTNQLRQSEIDKAWSAYELWSDYVELGRKYVPSAVFVVNLSDDRPPKYKSLVHEELDEYFHGFDTVELITRITSHISAASKTNSSDVKHLELPVQMPSALLQHLHHSLGILTKRTFKRIASTGRLDIGVGLSSIHFYTSGKTAFQPHLFGIEAVDTDHKDDHRGRSAVHDPWANAFDAAQVTNAKSLKSDSVIDYTSHPESAEKDFPIHSTLLINTSPGGYCIQWQGDVPKNVQAGELLCVRETSEKTWSVAVIRWIRRSKQQGTQLGIELLAPRARPCAVQQLNKTGKHSEFLRGLLLPELSSIGQPSTLITPRVPFKEGNKVILRFSGVESKCILSSTLAETGSFSQFVLSTTNMLDSKSPDIIDGEAGKEKENAKDFNVEDEFDSLWPSL